MLLINIKAILLVNILVIKEDQVKLPQWIAETGFIVLNQLSRASLHHLFRDH